MLYREDHTSHRGHGQNARKTRESTKHLLLGKRGIPLRVVVKIDPLHAKKNKIYIYVINGVKHLARHYPEDKVHMR